MIRAPVQRRKGLRSQKQIFTTLNVKIRSIWIMVVSEAEDVTSPMVAPSRNAGTRDTDLRTQARGPAPRISQSRSSSVCNCCDGKTIFADAGIVPQQVCYRISDCSASQRSRRCIPPSLPLELRGDFLNAHGESHAFENICRTT